MASGSSKLMITQTIVYSIHLGDAENNNIPAIRFYKSIMAKRIKLVVITVIAVIMRKLVMHEVNAPVLA